MPRITGEELNKLWHVGARQSFYRKTGDWFMCLERFPGALFDENGYIRFDTKQQYESCRQLHIGKRLTVRGGIAAIPGYVRIKPASS
jgi:hypothetical protein